MRFREKKDLFMKESPESPFPDKEREGFRGLRYFDPTPELRFGEVMLHRYPEPGNVIMTTSKGTRQLFNRIGFFEFAIGRRSFRLQAYQSAERDDPYVFVPFRDATSGGDSYGAARYLDLEVEHNDLYSLDFNHAYNPYCAYSDDYVCPLPPAENTLAVSVAAGERKYHD
jgi:hypothetical protein